MIPSNSLRDALWQLSYQFKVNIKRTITDQGLHLNGMHVRLLRLLAQQPHISANQLVAITARDKAQITRLIKELDAKGLLLRQANPTDKRSQLLSLSASGAELTRQTCAVEESLEERLLAGISAAEINTFIGLANRMLANLRDDA